MVPKRSIQWAVLVALASGLLLIGYIYKKYRMAPAIAFAEIEALDAQGTKVKVWQKSDRGAIIVFYASWCHDCARELPKLQRALQGPLHGAKVIALTDEDLSTMVKYRDQAKSDFHFYALLRDFGNYGIHAIPTVYVLNAQGETVFTKVGDVDWNSPALRRKIEAAALR